jgi:hypothetical protein
MREEGARAIPYTFDHHGDGGVALHLKAAPGEQGRLVEESLPAARRLAAHGSADAGRPALVGLPLPARARRCGGRAGAGQSARQGGVA